MVDGRPAKVVSELSACPFVELPGIELGAKIRLACGNDENRYAKPRETTWRDLRIHRRVLMASTRHDSAFVVEPRGLEPRICPTETIAELCRQAAVDVRWRCYAALV